jgi:hypothetical protein
MTDSGAYTALSAIPPGCLTCSPSTNDLPNERVASSKNSLFAASKTSPFPQLPHEHWRHRECLHRYYCPSSHDVSRAPHLPIFPRRLDKAIMSFQMALARASSCRFRRQRDPLRVRTLQVMRPLPWTLVDLGINLTL